MPAGHIHPFNVPKYMAAALRSIQFAKAKKRQILWVVCVLAMCGFLFRELSIVNLFVIAEKKFTF